MIRANMITGGAPDVITETLTNQSYTFTDAYTEAYVICTASGAGGSTQGAQWSKTGNATLTSLIALNSGASLYGACKLENVAIGDTITIDGLWTGSPTVTFNYTIIGW